MVERTPPNASIPRYPDHHPGPDEAAVWNRFASIRTRWWRVV